MNRFSIYLIFLIFISCTNNNQEDYFTNFNCEWDNTDFTLFFLQKTVNLKIFLTTTKLQL